MAESPRTGYRISRNFRSWFAFPVLSSKNQCDLRQRVAGLPDNRVVYDNPGFELRGL
jgi:hypothetical protein